MNFKPTKKGLLSADFLDRFGQECSIQESSYQEEDCIWFGVDKDLRGDQGARMHLTRDMVREVIPVLQHFVRTGALGVDDPEEKYAVGTWVTGIGEHNRGIEGRIVEAHLGQRIVVQVWSQKDPYVCAWDSIHLSWEPCEPPTAARTWYERLVSEDD